ncbi:hypothetical protein DSOL_5449 [Desulfosporosinus metallidurans]|uniref:Uncharacterized protein n=1 Tax=Desulfosporosinus metallidurans TaxID=1888891 RepID=A0A1Q8QAG4_9FIRM|nr:hypothetical protein DSOL_5449 [Desulfosporosinus metallidurans]
MLGDQINQEKARRIYESYLKKYPGNLSSPFIFRDIHRNMVG